MAEKDITARDLAQKVRVVSSFMRKFYSSLLAFLFNEWC